MAKSKTPATAETSSSRTTRTRTVPDMFMKQRAAASKRRNQQIDNSTDEEQDEDEVDELNSSDNDSEADSDVEMNTRNKKSATRKKRNNATANTVLETSSQLLEQVDESTQSTQASLYDQAIIPENDMEKVAQKWVKQYKRDKSSALKDLINFVIRSSGCLMAVTSDAIDQDNGSVQAIQELQDELSKLPHTEYPMISKLKEHKALRKNMLALFSEIISLCSQDAIYDGVFIETLQNWLATMSSSVYRPFRHTATIVGLRIISALCDVGEQCRHQLTNYKKQLKAAETRREAPKIRLLKSNSASAQQKCDDVEEFLTEFFNSIFVHRSRDVESIIRVECIKELGNWMQGYQAYFVSNNYLRFMGWAFNDRNGNVRCEVLKSLARLYKIENIAEKLKVFSNRFKVRVEQMALNDVDVSVRVNAIQLISSLYKLDIHILSEDGRTTLLNRIGSDVPRVRKSAAPFVKAMIESSVINPLLQEVTNSLAEASARTRTGRRSAAAAAPATPVNKTWVTFKGLASFLVEQIADTDSDEMQVDTEASAQNEKRNVMITNIVEALWDQMKDLQDYTSLSDYLSRDHSQTQQQQTEMDTEDTNIEDCYRLSEDEESILVYVFVACLRTAFKKGLDKNFPEGKEKKKMDDEMLQENKDEISRFLVQALPKLLTKNSDDVNRMTQLVSIPAMMNLNVYSELRAEQVYEDLLETLSRVYLGANMNDLLTNCADSLQRITKNTSLLEINNTHLDALKESVVNQVREACNGKDLVTCVYTPDLIHSVSVSMLRLACLINFLDATTAMDDSQGASANVIDHVGDLIDRAAFGNEEEKSICHSALNVVSRYMMWKINSLSPSSTIDVIPPIERRRDWAIDKLVELATGSDVIPLAEIRTAAFGFLVDIYWCFTTDLLDEYNLSRLKTRCPADLQKSCTKYVSEELKAYNTLVTESTDSENEESRKKLADAKEMIFQLVNSYSRGIVVGVFDISNASLLLEEYGSKTLEIDDTIKALASEFQEDLITGEVAADGICRVYLGALKNSFNAHVGDSGRSIDKTLKLARLEASSIKQANKINPARKVPPHIVCERIHLDGISFALTKAGEAYANSRDDEKDNALKFFKILTVFAKDLDRARDIAKIHNHLEDGLRQANLAYEENEKEWEHYANYVKAIDDVLKKKGLRYDPSRRANNAETPAAHLFDDVGMEEPAAEVDELAVAKRSLVEAEMDVDNEVAPKRRRD